MHAPTLTRRALLRTGVALAATPLAVAQAETKLLTIVLGYAPGGPVDIAARQLAQHLPDLLGRPVIVDYKPGAGGQFALTALKQAAADGSVLALSPPSPLTIFPSTFSKLAYDPFKDFVPVTTACTFDFAFAVGANHPARSLSEFIAWCKQNPKQANLGVAGLGTTPHFLGWTLANKASIDLTAVPYKGTAQMAQEVAAGDLACAISPQANFAELVKGGRLRLLGTTGVTRSTVFPSVPTFNEAGFAGLQSEEWFALFARSGTPQPLLDGVADAVRKVVAREDVRQVFTGMGFHPEARSSAQLVKDIRADFERWAEVVRKTGFKAES